MCSFKTLLRYAGLTRLLIIGAMLASASTYGAIGDDGDDINTPPPRGGGWLDDRPATEPAKGEEKKPNQGILKKWFHKAGGNSEGH